jgi:hypothetical protein
MLRHMTAYRHFHEARPATALITVTCASEILVEFQLRAGAEASDLGADLKVLALEWLFQHMKEDNHERQHERSNRGHRT